MRFISFLSVIACVGLLSSAAAKPPLSVQLLTAEDHRVAADPSFGVALKGKSTKQKIIALRALGRIQDPDSIALIAPMLDAPQLKVAATAAFALGLIDDDQSRTSLRNRIKNPSKPALLAEISVAMGRIGDKSDVDFLVENLEAKNPLVLQKTAVAIGNLFAYRLKAVPEVSILERLIKLAGHRVKRVSAAAAFALGRVGELPESVRGAAVKRFTSIRDPQTKGLFARVLGKISTDESRDALVRAYLRRNTLSRVEVIRALSKQAQNPKSWRLLRRAMLDRNPQISAQALSALRVTKNVPEFLKKSVLKLALKPKQQWLSSEALKTLAVVDEPVFKQNFQGFLNSKQTLVKQVAISEMHRLVGDDESVVSQLVAFTTDKNSRLATAAVESLTALDKKYITVEVIASVSTLLTQGDEALTYYAADFATNHKLAEMVPDLVAALSKADVESSVALLDAIGTLGDATHAEGLKPFVASSTKQVSSAAARAIEKLSGENLSNLVPLNSVITDKTPSMKEIRTALNSRLIFVTNKGQFAMSMYDVAPLTVAKIVRLAKKGYYNGLTFHRVVPNFVVQGGDPRGDGFGGPGYSIREEISTLSHVRGAVGMATAGKDTGGSQFFVNHASNLHLDGRYTVFAHVTRGMNVVDRLAQDDVIKRVIVSRVR